MRITIILLVFGLALPAAQTPGDAIEDAVADFDRTIELAFGKSQAGLDRYRESRIKDAAREIRSRLGGAEGDEALVLAYQLLRLEPEDRAALAAFGEAGSPFADSGGLRRFDIPAADGALAVEALGWLDFPRAEVIDATTKVLKRFGSAGKDRASKKLYTTLLALRKGHPKLVEPVLGFYFPGKGSRGRGWVSPVDKYLLRHGLVTTELAYGDRRFDQAQSERLPMALPCYRIELATVAGQPCTVELRSPGNRGLTLHVGDGAVRVMAGDAELARHDGPAATVEVDVRQRQGLLSIDARPVAPFELEQAFAVDRISVPAGSAAHILRLRYLADGELVAPPETDLVAAAEAQAAATALSDELLATPITISAEDQPAGDLVAAIATISGIQLRFDPSAEAFTEVPLSLEAQDMPLSQVLGWFKRSLELDHRADGDVVVLTWGE